MIPEFLDKNLIVYKYDGMTFLNSLTPESVQLIWTRPPFSNDLEIGSTKTVSMMEATELCAAVADAASRILSPSGVLAICLSNQNTEGVLAAVSKRTHLQFGGYQIDSVDIDSTTLVFHKGEPRFNGVTAYCGPDDLVSMITPFIEEHTDPGDVVVDPFCESGIVVEAAVSLGRVAVVNDQDPNAVSATVERYKELCAQ